MKGKMFSDRIRKKLACHAEIDRMALRYITHNDTLPERSRMLAQLKLNSMKAYHSMSRMVRRCTLTGRARAVLEEFNISRMKFRQMALANQLVGIRKSSW
jgi:small subunit ribosomal protein S14